jgi:Tfp pilus assembly protein PilF
LLQEAYRAQMEGDYDHAVELYKNSLELFPTAEAHTFLGWTYHFQGKIAAAMAECKLAIAVDPEFGNPYNDIGAYLIAKGQLDEAIEWLEKAKTAPKYEPRHYPFMNLAKLFAQKGMVVKAIAEFEAALQIAQREGGDENAAASISEQLRQLRGMLN